MGGDGQRAPVRRDTVEVEIDLRTPDAETPLVLGTVRTDAPLTDRTWLALPSRAAPRWHLPAGPRAVAVGGLGIYDPMTPRARAVWGGARWVAVSGGFRVLGRRDHAPPRRVLDLLAPHVPPGGTLAVANGNHPGRSTALVLDGRTGRALRFVKVALDEGDAGIFAQEVGLARQLGAYLPPGLRTPEIHHVDRQVAVFEAVPALTRARPWQLPPSVAFALGRFFRNGARQDGLGPAHGDCAPWNLLRGLRGWYLVDWADARVDAPPFEDVLHHLVQAHALLGNPSRRALLAGFELRGPVGHLLRRYAEGAALDPRRARQLAPDYLERSREPLDPEAADGAAGRAAREELLRALAA